MEAIINPINKSLLEKELTGEIFVRDTVFGNNQIFIFTHHQAPNLMTEIGRLREITFRNASGGTGKSIDVDSFDLSDTPFKQLIVWNPDEKEIIGGYRFIDCNELEIDADGNVLTPTARLFNYSEKFIKEYLPYTIELGRSFVQPEYQPTKNIRRGMYSLDNIWDGLGAIIKDHKESKYLFGKVTMYSNFNREARDLILYFMHLYFPDNDGLVKAIKPMSYTHNTDLFKPLFVGNKYPADFRVLIKRVRQLGEHVPPLFTSYMNVSPTMKTFGTALNDHFGSVEETGIMVTTKDIHIQKKKRHIDSYIQK